MKKIAIGVFFLLQPNMASTAGLSYSSALYINAVLFILVSLLTKSRSKYFYAFSLFFLGLMLFRIYMGILSESVQFCVTMVLPAIIALVLPDSAERNKDYSFYRLLLKCVALFYGIEILFSFVEYIGHFSILHYTNDTYGTGSVLTRAVALSGAPLTNSLIISCLLMFILNSKLRQNVKFLLWGGGMIALLCFQGRLSCIVSVSYLLFYLLTHLSGNARKNVITVLFVVVIIIALLLALYLGLGTRLFEQKLFDESSSGVRVRMFEYLTTMKASNFLFGTAYKNVQFIMMEMNVLIIECFVVIHCMLFGIVFTIICYSLYGFLFKSLFAQYKIIEKMPIIVGFFVVAFINNSLASTFVPLTFFMLFAKLFSPNIFERIVPPKYLE